MRGRTDRLNRSADHISMRDDGRAGSHRSCRSTGPPHDLAHRQINRVARTCSHHAGAFGDRAGRTVAPTRSIASTLTLSISGTTRTGRRLRRTRAVRAVHPVPPPRLPDGHLSQGEWASLNRRCRPSTHLKTTRLPCWTVPSTHLARQRRTKVIPLSSPAHPTAPTSARQSSAGARTHESRATVEGSKIRCGRPFQNGRPGPVAQWSEQGTHNPSVEGSIPSRPTRKGISRACEYDLVASGELPHLRLGRRLVIPERVIEDLLDVGESGI